MEWTDPGLHLAFACSLYCLRTRASCGQLMPAPRVPCQARGPAATGGPNTNGPGCDHMHDLILEVEQMARCPPARLVRDLCPPARGAAAYPSQVQRAPSVRARVHGCGRSTRRSSSAAAIAVPTKSECFKSTGTAKLRSDAQADAERRVRTEPDAGRRRLSAPRPDGVPPRPTS